MAERSWTKKFLRVRLLSSLVTLHIPILWWSNSLSSSCESFVHPPSGEVSSHPLVMSLSSLFLCLGLFLLIAKLPLDKYSTPHSHAAFLLYIYCVLILLLRLLPTSLFSSLFKIKSCPPWANDTRATHPLFLTFCLQRKLCQNYFKLFYEARKICNGRSKALGVENFVV